MGNIANYPYMLAKTLRRRGLDVRLLFQQRDFIFSHPQWDEGDFEFEGIETAYSGATAEEVAQTLGPEKWGKSQDWVHKVRGERQDHLRPSGIAKDLRALGTSYFRNVLRIAREKDTFSSLELIEGMSDSDLNIPQSGFIRLAPLARRQFIPACVGADITELPFQDSHAGKRQAEALRRAPAVVLHEARYRSYAEKLGLKTAVWLPWCIDPENYPREEPARTREIRDRLSGDPLILHPSRTDFATKGTDIFIRGFAAFSKRTESGMLILAGWGKDCARARAMVDELGIKERVSFVPAMSKMRLMAHYYAADVVADQLIVGGYGGAGLDALALGKPLMIWLNEADIVREIGELPPVLNVRTEEEVAAALDKVAQGTTTGLGDAARKWVRQHHGVDVVVPKWTELLSRVLESSGTRLKVGAP